MVIVPTNQTWKFHHWMGVSRLPHLSKWRLETYRALPVEQQVTGTVHINLPVHMETHVTTQPGISHMVNFL